MAPEGQGVVVAAAAWLLRAIAAAGGKAVGFARIGRSDPEERRGSEAAGFPPLESGSQLLFVLPLTNWHHLASLGPRLRR